MNISQTILTFLVSALYLGPINNLNLYYCKCVNLSTLASNYIIAYMKNMVLSYFLLAKLDLRSCIHDEPPLLEYLNFLTSCGLLQGFFFDTHRGYRYNVAYENPGWLRIGVFCRILLSLSHGSPTRVYSNLS